MVEVIVDQLKKTVFRKCCKQGERRKKGTVKTPKAYQKMLACDQLTDELIGQVTYSISKRAKNYRDKAADYRHDRFDRYNNFQQYQDK